jgi:hypothetical protein
LVSCQENPLVAKLLHAIILANHEHKAELLAGDYLAEAFFPRQEEDLSFLSNKRFLSRLFVSGGLKCVVDLRVLPLRTRKKIGPMPSSFSVACAKILQNTTVWFT